MLTSLSVVKHKRSSLVLSPLLCNTIQLDSYISLQSLTALGLINFRVVGKERRVPAFLSVRAVLDLSVKIGRVLATLIRAWG